MIRKQSLVLNLDIKENLIEFFTPDISLLGTSKLESFAQASPIKSSSLIDESLTKGYSMTVIISKASLFDKINVV